MDLYLRCCATPLVAVSPQVGVEQSTRNDQRFLAEILGALGPYHAGGVVVFVLVCL